jgi:hypothetical protein
MVTKLKLKYRTPFTSPRHSYRSRTGPHCCSGNCGAAWRRREHKLKKYNYGRAIA